MRSGTYPPFNSTAISSLCITVFVSLRFFTLEFSFGLFALFFLVPGGRLSGHSHSRRIPYKPGMELCFIVSPAVYVWGKWDHDVQIVCWMKRQLQCPRLDRTSTECTSGQVTHHHCQALYLMHLGSRASNVFPATCLVGPSSVELYRAMAHKPSRTTLGT